MICSDNTIFVLLTQVRVVSSMIDFKNCSLGRRGAGQDPTAVEALLPKHAGADLRGGLERQRPRGRSTR